MPTITTEVDIDLDDFYDDDLVEELEGRGYSVYKNNAGDQDLIDCIEDRGFTVYGKGHKPHVTRAYVEELYSTYLTMDREFFEKELIKFFRQQLDVSEY